MNDKGRGGATPDAGHQSGPGCQLHLGIIADFEASTCHLSALVHLVLRHTSRLELLSPRERNQVYHIESSTWQELPVSDPHIS